MKAGYVQFAPTYLEVEDNIKAVGELLSGVEADLLVLPELFTSGYFFQSEEDLRFVAEPIPEGPTTQRLRAWASETGTTLVAGLAEQEKDRLYNSAVLVRPDGSFESYRKVHLFYEETTLFEPGDLGLRVFDVKTREGDPYKLGVMVCFDWYFPEAARTLALRGADVIAHPSNLVLPHCPDSMPIRARENHVFTITANRYGTERKGEEELTFIGMSEICDPKGEIMHRSDRTGDVVTTVALDPKEARDRNINEMNDVLADRRPDVYAVG
jgi:predicted amidohydrolase